MDSSRESQLIDSYEYTALPDERNSGESQTQLYGTEFNHQVKNVHLFEKFCKKKTRKRTTSATSLFLYKTDERELCNEETLSFASLLCQDSNIHILCDQPQSPCEPKPKPLLKITVLNCGKKPSKLQSENCKLKNHPCVKEHFVHAKNLFIVVGGCDKEKIYELKTVDCTSVLERRKQRSACQPNDVYNLEQIQGYELSNQFEMEKRKKSSQMKHGNDTVRTSSKNQTYTASEMQNDFTPYHLCSCPQGEKSRIKITGRLGITEDDRYVLDCAATVNDKPIVTKFSQNLNTDTHLYESQNVSNRDSVLRDDSRHKRERSPKKQDYIQLNTEQTKPIVQNNVYGYNEEKDFHYNADVGNNFLDGRPVKPLDLDNCETKKKKSNCKPSVSDNCETRKKNSNCKPSVPDNCETRKKNSNCRVIENSSCVGPPPECVQIKKNLSCCRNEDDGEVQESTCDRKGKRLHKSQSPIVIISVYPKGELCYGNKTNAYNLNVKQQKNYNTRDSFQPENIKQMTRSRSPSPPVKLTGKSNSPNKNYYPSSKGNSRSSSPERSSLSRNFERIFTPKSSPKEKPMTPTMRRQNLQTYKVANDNRKKTTPSKMVTQGTNTEVKLKKDTIKNYNNVVSKEQTNEIKPTNDCDRCPKSDMSNITVSIDGGSEYYNVMYHKGNLTTDLRVRKTNKDIESDYKNQGDSMENIMLETQKGQRRSLSETMAYNNQTQLRNKTSNVKEKKDFSGKKSPIQGSLLKKKKQINDNKPSNNIKTQSKHYRGDDCSLTDPMERDKQIRELLGVEKGNQNSTKNKRANIQACEEVGVQVSHYASNFDLHDISGPCYLNHRKVRSSVNVLQDFNNNGFEETGSPNMLDDIIDANRNKVLILNRNIQMFLQVEQFTKRKPIILSRKQYDKVKRTIQKTLSSSKNGRENPRKIQRHCVVSVGDVRVSPKPHNIPNYDKETQTQEKIESSNENFSSNMHLPENYEVTEEAPDDATKPEPNEQNDQQILHRPKCAFSSMEIRYASVSFVKHMASSPENIEPNVKEKKVRSCHSVHTLYKGHKKSVTPNLGTSIYSLYPEGGSQNAEKPMKNVLVPQEIKQRKPFLKRLMSCLVMRSAKASDMKIEGPPEAKILSVNSTIDSYHISSSMGAIEMSSSIYDTSVSFNSSHAVYPINKKMKRGFFSSVRGFLTSRKS